MTAAARMVSRFTRNPLAQYFEHREAVRLFTFAKVCGDVTGRAIDQDLNTKWEELSVLL